MRKIVHQCFKTFGRHGYQSRCRKVNAEIRRAIGFTLVELLVVLVVISLLAALLLPALNRAKEASYSAVCKSNLRQWGIGLRLYTQECEGYPTDVLYGMDGYDFKRWYTRLGPYTGSRWQGNNLANGEAVLGCPAYARLPSAFYADRIGSYGYNGNGIGGMGLILSSSGQTQDMQTTKDPDPTVKESSVLNPCDMIAIGDTTLYTVSFSSGSPPFYTAGDYQLSILYGWGAPGPMLGLAFPTVSSDNSFARQCLSLINKRHAGRFNVAFCDSHVENLAIGTLFDIRKETVAMRWNRDNRPHLELSPIQFQ